MKMRRLFLSIILTAMMLSASAQVNIQFIPEIQGRNIDGLFNARIYSATAKRNVSLTITVSERKKGRVLTIKTPAFSINPGSSNIPASAVRPARLQFANNNFSSQIQQSGMLPEGDYEYCFILTPEQGGLDPESPAEQCYSAEVTPLSPINLTEPANQDKICLPRPMFSWQPSFPSINGSAYQLILTEVKEKQSATEAINYNLPLISQNGIVAPALNFPASYKELKAGKKYAWQVSMYKNQTVLNRSEVWEFTVDCKDSVKDVPDLTGVGFRDIDDLAKGGFYIAMGGIRFAMVNPYQAQVLKYEIECLTDPDIKVKKLPVIQLTRGLNEITIDLRNNDAFKDLNYYNLKVWRSDGSTQVLKIFYRESAE